MSRPFQPIEMKRIASMTSTILRRSDRVSIAVPIQVFGTEFTGEAFMEQTQTQLLSRHGAALVLSRKLVPQQQIVVRNMITRREAAAQIVGLIGGEPDAYIYGVSFLDPTLKLWDVNFLPLSAEDEASFRLVLQCQVCANLEQVLLKEFETDVFDANRDLTRDCRRCGEPTRWQVAAQEVLAERPRNGNARRARASSPYANDPVSQNERKGPPEKLNISACVRQPGFDGQEIVEVEKVSPDGLSFLSARSYYSGSILDVAAPYKLEAANVFVRSRLIRIQDMPGTVRKRYDVGYLGNS